MTFGLLCGDYFSYHKGMSIYEIGLLLLILFLVLIISRFVFKVKLEKNLFSKEELTAKPLYQPNDILLMDAPYDKNLNVLPSKMIQAWWSRMLVILACIVLVFLPISI